MKILPMTNPDDLGEVAEWILEKALKDPKAGTLIEQLIKDCQANREQLFHTAFSMGVVSALSEMMQGHVVQVGSSPSHSDS